MIIYLGPVIKGVVRRNQIFNYDPQEIIGKASAILPTAKYLFADLNDIAQKKKELKTPGSLLALVYEELEKQLSKGGNENAYI